ncbi:MAG: hypoxanthine phosphoribosyltransferase [Actinomycetota bacterium]|jgi:hypoxanthine phosphoribosyltransferase|nr:hypoxanthine phosphoribosyltransferase [Actinomycetota bacterium]
MSVLTEVVTSEALRERVAELGEEIRSDYRGREPVLLGVLNGAVPFLADLSRHLPPDVEIDFLSLTRFGDEGRVGIAMDSATSLAGRDVLIVEDVVDTGLTLSYLLSLLDTRGPASLATATLLDKTTRRIVDVDLAYRGFEVGDEFLLGYGLDWDGRYRNVPSLWAVLDLAEFREDPEVLARTVFGEASDSLKR